MKNFFKSLLYLGAYFVVQLITQTIFMIAAATSGIKSESGLEQFSINHLLLITIISNLVTIVLFGIFLKIRKKRITQELGLASVKIKSYIYPSITVFLLSFAWAYATYTFSFANAEQIEQSVSFYDKIFPGLGMAIRIIMLLLAQPIMEEVLCRGIMLNKLKNSMPAWGAILVSSLLFGILHLMAGGIWLVVGATLMGLCFGIIFVKTGSLYVAIVSHSIANLPDFIMPYLPELAFETRIILSLVLATISLIMIVFLCKKNVKYIDE